MHPTRFILPLFTSIALGAVIPTGAFAEAPTAREASSPSTQLKVGSVAPALKPQEWLKGEPVSAFAKDKTYLIVCWATWDGPSVAAMLNANGLHKKFKDKGLVVVGMDVWEDDAAKSAKFLLKKGDDIAYRIAFDGGESGDIAINWLKAAGVNGIPYAFVIREGKILWQGHPSELEDDLVEPMVAGKYNPVQADKDRAAKEARQEKLRSAMQEVIALFKGSKFDEALAKLDSAEKDAEGEEIDKIRFCRAGILVEKGDAGAGKNLVALANGSPDKLAFQYFAADQLLNSPKLKNQRDPKAAKVCIVRLIADSPGEPMLLLLDAQADYAVGDKAGAEKTLSALVTSTEKNAARILPKVKAALEAVKAGKEWISDNE